MAKGQPAVFELIEATVGSKAVLMGVSLFYSKPFYVLFAHCFGTEKARPIICIVDFVPGYLHKKLCGSLAPGPEEPVPP